MRKEKYEIVIVGAGPAGLKAAEVLAEAGKRVLVLEKNKIVGRKPCGGGLSRKFLEIDFPLEEVGDRFFKSVFYYYNEKKHKISARSPLIVITEREKLGAHMKKIAEEKGAKIRLNCPVTKILEKFVVAGNSKIYFDYLIGADGSNSVVRKFLKIPSKRFLFSLGYIVQDYYKKLEIFFDNNLFRDGYGAIFPHKNYTQIGITVDAKFFTMKEAKELLDKWIKKRGFNIEKGKFGAGIINYDYRGFNFKDRFFLVGDAGGFASGFNGEGIFQAIVSGKEVARKILDSKYKCNGIDHLLGLKFFHEKIFKRILKTKSRLIFEWGARFTIISANPKFYNLYFKIKPIAKNK